MSTHDDPILTAVLSLSSEERSKLADQLLSRLRIAPDGDVDPADAETRIEALRRGDSNLLADITANRT